MLFVDDDGHNTTCGGGGRGEKQSMSRALGEAAARVELTDSASLATHLIKGDRAFVCHVSLLPV